MSKTYLVTGGTGFLGQHLVRQLITQDKAQVRILARSRDRALERLGATFFRGSVLQPAQLQEAMRGIDGIFHLAGKVERDIQRAHTLFTLHVTGTRNVLEAAVEHGVKRIVVASTSGTVAVTEDGRVIPNDESEHATELVQGWPYYLSKVYAEKTALALAERKGLELILMRPTLLLGPGDSRLSSTKDVLQFLQGNIPFMPSGGLSFVDVRDTAEAFRTAMERGRPGASYLLGAANLTFEAFFERLEHISGVPRPKITVPNQAARFGSRLLGSAIKLTGKTPDLDPVSVEMSQHFWYLDWSAAMRELDFQPRDPGQTLYDTVQWLRTNQPKAQSSTPPPTVDPNTPFAPDQPWQEPELRHAAYTRPSNASSTARDETLHPSTAGIPEAYVGQSRLSYDTYGDGPGLESLLSGTIKGAVGALWSAGKTAVQKTDGPPPQNSAPHTDWASTLEGPSKPEKRGELMRLLQDATDEELDTILRLVRRMKS